MHSSVKHAAFVAVAASALLSASSSAQQAGVGPRWQAWIGCWTATQPGGEYGSSQLSAPTVCITPTSDANVVDVSTISGGKLVARDRIDASGQDRAIDAKGCTGAQRGEWSADERRVYLKAATSCDGMKGATTAILGMTAQGEWIDVRDVIAGGASNVRVARYHDVGIPSSVPADIAAALNGRQMSSQSARIAAGAPIGTKAVIEAVRMTDSSVVSAWLLERGQRFSLGAKELLALADAGLPAAVTDAMVAVTYPGAFQVARADDRRDADDPYAGRRTRVFMDPFYDPYGWGYSRYGNNGYGYNGYGNGYGYGGYNGGYYGGPPIIIVTGAQSGSASGQMVKGRGYTQNQPSATPDRSGSERSSSSSGSSSSGSSSSGSSNSGSSQPAPAAQPAQPAQRTAHPKP